MYTNELKGHKPPSEPNTVDFTFTEVRPTLSGGVSSTSHAFGRGQRTSGFLAGIEARRPVQLHSNGPTTSAARSYGHLNRTRWPYV